MNVLQVISLFTALFALFQGIFVLVLDRKVKEHVLFFFITLCIAEWSFSAAMGHGAENVEQVRFWMHATSPGFCFLHVFTLWFVIVLTGMDSKYLRLKIILLFVPSIFFTWYGFNFPFVFRDFYKEGAFWIGTPTFESPVFLIFILQYLSYYTASVILLLRWSRRSGSNRIRRQGSIMVVLISVTILLFNIEPFLFPLLTGYKTSAGSVNAGIVWITGFWIAILRFRLFTWESFHLITDIFNSVDQLLILLDSNYRIQMFNEHAARVFNKSFAEVRGCNIGIIIPDWNPVKCAAELQKAAVFFSAVSSDDKNINIKFKVRPMYDQYKDYYGILLSGIVSKSFDVLQDKFNLTQRELAIVIHIANGLNNLEISDKDSISISTVKSHLNHIYNKTGTSSRIELLKLLSDYNSHDDQVSSLYSMKNS